MSFVLSHAGDALRLAFDMFWAVLWPLAFSATILSLSPPMVPSVVFRVANSVPMLSCAAWRCVA